MTGFSEQSRGGGRGGAWTLAREQHGVLTHRQLEDLGLTRHGIQHRIDRGRLHPVARGVYAVGRPELAREGRWMAAVLACGGPRLAGLSHSSAAALYGIGPERAKGIEVTRISTGMTRLPGVKVYRRVDLRGGFVIRNGIPVTSPVQTLIDLAARHEPETVERFVNEADHLRVVRTDALRKALDTHAGERGVGRLRTILDRRTFRYTRSGLERAFLPLVRDAGLPLPRTSVHVNGYEVDFHFPDLALVVEADSLTYHRTPAHQADDARRDQDHAAAGTHTLRFTHGQIKYEPERVARILRATVRRLPGWLPADRPRPL